MWVAFIDESGFTKNWAKDIEQQPYFIYSALLIESSCVNSFKEEVNNRLNQSGEKPFGEKQIGRNFEIKGTKVIKEYIRKPEYANKKNIDSIKIFIDSGEFYHQYDLCQFINIIINKRRLASKYIRCYNPYDLAFYFLLERIEHLMRNLNDHCILICDFNHLNEKDTTKLIEMVFECGKFFNRSEGIPTSSIQFLNSFDHILEISFTQSHLSLGVVIADSAAGIIQNMLKNPTDMVSSGLIEYHRKIVNMSPVIIINPGHFVKGYLQWP
jgi:hypothetical protein